MSFRLSLETFQRQSFVRRLAVVTPLALLGLVYILYAALKRSAPHADFNYFWLAGHLWDRGLDPYGPIFEVEGRKLSSMYPSIYWPYPPNWWPISVMLAQLTLDRGTELWIAASIALTAASCELLRRSREALGLIAQFDQTLLLFSFVSLSTATGTVMMWGNCSLLILFGSALLALGLTSRNHFAAVAGLAIIALKPTIGLPVLAAVVLSKGWSRTGIAAGVVIGLMALPALFISTPERIVAGLAATARAYGSIPANAAENQPGIVQLAFSFLGITIQGFTAVILASLSAVGLVLLLRFFGDDRSTNAVPVLFAGLASAGIFSLHGYDLPVVLPLLAVASYQGRAAFILVLVGFMLLFRPQNIATVIDFVAGPKLLAASLPSIGLLLIYCAAVMICVGRFRSAAGAEAHPQ